MLSRKYKCIYIHIPKVAGQSIEHVFLDLHGLTWEERAPLLLRPNDDPAIGPPRLAHLKASEYVSCGHVSQDDFDSFFKFAFVRNPWSRIVSVYTYLGFTEIMPFKQFIQTDFSGHDRWEAYLFKAPQYEYLFDGEDRQLVDFVGKFENLQNDFNEVCERLGIEETKLPYVNKTGSGRDKLTALKKIIKRISPLHHNYEVKGSYAAYYDDESRKLVSKLYEKEIDLFKYAFGE